jgi:cation:H+ antiporter
MLDLVFWIIALIIGLAVLVKSSDYFTDSAEKIGIHFKINPFIIGVTIVAIGTTLPDLVSSFIAIFLGFPEIAIGNAIGANIVKILFVIGLTALIGKNIKIHYELKHFELPFLIGVTFLLALIVFDGKLVLLEAIFLVSILILYLIRTIYSGERANIAIKRNLKKEKGLLTNGGELQKTTLLILVGSAIFIYLGANLTINTVIIISEMIGISTGIIALSIISIGTSLPELAVCISAALKKQPEMAIGTIIGSNILNSLAVLGIPGVVGILLFGPMVFEISFIIILVLLASTLLFVFMIEDKEITVWEGMLLIIFYLFFLAYLFGLV